MARHNNTSRSLIIMSKLQGWDPTKLEGEPLFGGGYPEDRVTKGETQLQGHPPTSPESKHPSVSPPEPQGSVPSRSKHNPNAGK